MKYIEHREHLNFGSQNVPNLDGANSLNYREWYSKTRVILPLLNKDTFDVMSGAPERSPSYSEDNRAGEQTTPDNANSIRLWKRVCENLFPILFLVTSGPAATIVKQHERKIPEDRLANGQEA